MWNLLQDELGGGVWPRLLVVLVDTGAKGLILMAAAGLAAAAMRRNAAAARHLVWMLALCGLLLLPVVSLMMPKWTLPILPATEAPAEAPIAVTPPLTTAPAAPAVVSTPVAEVAPEVTNVIPPAARSERPTAPIGATPPESAQAPMNYGAWLLATWLAFALLSLAPFAAGIVAVARMRRRAEVFSEGDLQSLASTLCLSIGLKRPARLLRGPAGSMPMATGFLRSAVFLPDDALAWTEEKRRVVLLHELAHVKRRDCLTHAIARTATALHWFSPLAWLALRQLRIEREHACDDLVLAAGERPSAYAENLLEIARTLRASTVVSAAAITMAQKSQLEGRLIAVLDAARNRSVPTPRVVAGLFFIAGMTCAVIAACQLTPAASTGRLERETFAAGVTAQSQERDFVATYANGLQARILGVGEPDGYTVFRVWAPDGVSLPGVPEGFKSKMGGSGSDKSGVTRRLFIEVLPVPEESDLGLKFKVEGNSVSHIVDRSQGRRCANVQIYNIPDNPGGTSLELGIAAGPWESVHGTTGPHSTLDGSTFSAAYSDFFEKDGKAHVVVTHTPRDDDYRLAVYDKNDTPYPTRETSSSGVGTMRQTEFVVEGEVRASDLLYMDLQARPYEWKTISGISLNPIDDTSAKSAKTLDTPNRWSSPSGEAPPEDASELPALNSIAFSRPGKWPNQWWNMDGSDTLPIFPSNYKPSASASLRLAAETSCNREFSLVLRGTGLEDIERSVGATTEKTSFHVDSKELTAHLDAARPVELVLRAGSGDWTEVTTLASRKRAKTDEGSFEITDEHPIRPKNRWFLPDVPAKVLVQLRYDFDPRWEIAIVAEDKDGNRSGVNTSVGNGGISTRSTARVRSQMVEMPFSQISRYVVLKRPVYEYDCGPVPTAPKAARMDQASPAEDAAVVSSADSFDSPYSVFNHDYLGTLLEDPNLLTHIAGDAITPPAADTSWGPVVNGLQAAVRFKPEKAEYALGETIGMEFLARNIGPIPLEFLTSKWRNGDQCVVTDEKGESRPGGTALFSGINPVRCVKLAPGEVAAIESASFTIMPEASGRSPLHPVATWARSHAGIHKAQFRIHFPDTYARSGENAPRPDDWTGTLMTGQRTIEFVDDPELFRAHSVFQIRMVAHTPGDKGSKTFPWEASSRPPGDVDKLWLLDDVLVGDGDLAAVEAVPGASSHQYAIEISLNEKASERLALATRENIGHRMACMYQEMVYAAPILNGPVGDGKLVVGGKFSKDVAESIVSEIRAANALDTEAPFMQASTTSILGPEVEVTVRHSGENCMIDFDTGELFTPPNFNGTEDVFAWAAKNGIDLGGGIQGERRGLTGMDLLLNPEDVTAWDNAATNLALNNDEFQFDRPRNPVYFGATDPLPATWTFKTREGGRGIFQILGSDHDEPKAVRIRYRMLGKGSK